MICRVISIIFENFPLLFCAGSILFVFSVLSSYINQHEKYDFMRMDYIRIHFRASLYAFVFLFLQAVAGDTTNLDLLFFIMEIVGFMHLTYIQNPDQGGTFEEWDSIAGALHFASVTFSEKIWIGVYLVQMVVSYILCKKDGDDERWTKKKYMSLICAVEVLVMAWLYEVEMAGINQNDSFLIKFLVAVVILNVGLPWVNNILVARVMEKKSFEY